MARKLPTSGRRTDQLSRETIVATAIALLDASGEEGLTFRALAERLSTGAGAIYWHIANKNELMIAACDAVIARTLVMAAPAAKPDAVIRAVALSLFDAIDAHPWVGSALAQALGQMPMVRILESLGRPVQALGVPAKDQWATVGALLNYILGVGGRNAANGQLARTRGLDRSDFLENVSLTWSALDPAEFPFARSLAAQVRAHDDREDFVAGVDLILKGIAASPSRRRPARR